MPVMQEAPPGTVGLEEQVFEEHRAALTAYAYRMLGSPFEAEDAVQEAFIRAWRGYERFEGRAALKSWLYKITTNVCLDMLGSRERRARPMDLGPSGEPVIESLRELPEVTWIEPTPDPADAAIASETIKLAFVAALQHLPPKQRAVLILCEVLRWQASEAAELLGDERCLGDERASAGARDARGRRHAAGKPVAELDEADRALLDRYVEAFEAYDVGRLTALLHEDATQSMPPYDLWLHGRDDIFTWWLGPGSAARARG